MANNWIPRAEFFLQSLVSFQPQCPYCKSRNAKTIFRKYGSIRIKQCPECLLCYTSPIYKSWIVKNIYGAFYEADGVTRFPDPVRLEQLKETNFKGSEKDFSWILEPLAALLSEKKGRLLEVGSAWGYFLYQAKQHGFDPAGIEINEKAVAFGKERLGVRIVKGFEELEKGSFDLVFSWHALEHFTDLSRIFSDIEKATKPGGHLLIVVPNFDWEQFGTGRAQLIGAVHPIGFSAEFFLRNLPRHGFFVEGVFDDVKNFPNQPCQIATGGGIIVWAKKQH